MTNQQNAGLQTVPALADSQAINYGWPLWSKELKAWAGILIIILTMIAIAPAIKSH